jgi:hypothetical protein
MENEYKIIESLAAPHPHTSPEMQLKVINEQ